MKRAGRYDFDLFTIGGGSGGVRASRVAADYGARVALAESGRFGGTCVNVGCIPKKLFSYAAHFRDDFEDAAAYGWSLAVPGFDWKTLVANKDKEIARLNGIYRRLLEGSGVTIFEARAVLKDPHTLDVGGKTVTAEHILIATGGWPVVPDIPGKELAITSNEAFYLARLPRRVIIVGGGYIAVEFAGIFAALGAQVDLVYRQPLPLRGFDHDLREALAAVRAARETGLAVAASRRHHAGRARHVLDDPIRLSRHVVGEVPRHQPPEQVDRPARGVGHHDADRPTGKIRSGRLRWRSNRERRGAEHSDSYCSFHRKSSL